VNTREKILLLFVLGVTPMLLGLAVFALSFRRAEQLSFCAQCHTMTPWVSDLKDPNSLSLASKHYRNRWILNDQCYTCHEHYQFMGPVDAKMDGMRHVVAYYTGIGMPHAAIKLYEPYPNGNCLRCHGAASNFINNPTHKAVAAQITNNQLRCIVCHQPFHTPEVNSDAKAG
jgi:nitrate/TMAO reductase-like tetraheme cytochrome c subunit